MSGANDTGSEARHIPIGLFVILSEAKDLQLQMLQVEILRWAQDDSSGSPS
jgi:hypothetical protein